MAYFQLISEWWLDAPVERVWARLSSYQALPSWWPSFELAEPLAGEHAETIRYRVRAALGAKLSFVQHTEATRVHEHIQFRSDGDLVGTGIWVFYPLGVRTRVVFAWNVDLARPSWRALSRIPGMRALFSRSHARVMAEGQRHLQAALANPTQLMRSAAPGSRSPPP